MDGHHGKDACQILSDGNWLAGVSRRGEEGWGVDRKPGSKMVQVQEQSLWRGRKAQAKLPLSHWSSGISLDNCQHLVAN